MSANPIPLTAPNGVVYAYACPTCHRVREAPIALVTEGDGPNPDTVEWQREKAEACCVCRDCRKVERDGGYNCKACRRSSFLWARWTWQWRAVGVCVRDGITTPEQWDAHCDKEDEDA